MECKNCNFIAHKSCFYKYEGPEADLEKMQEAAEVEYRCKVMWFIAGIVAIPIVGAIMGGILQTMNPAKVGLKWVLPLMGAILSSAVLGGVSIVGIKKLSERQRAK